MTENDKGQAAVRVDRATMAKIAAEAKRLGVSQRELVGRLVRNLPDHSPVERRAFLLRRAAVEVELGDFLESDRLLALAAEIQLDAAVA